MKKVGFLGLGNMGKGMAANLIKKSGEKLYGYDVMESARSWFQTTGGILTEDAEELYRTSDLLFLCLPTNEIVRSTIMAIMETAKEGTIIVDMGSTAPHLIRELAGQMKEKKLHLLDAPVSGGQAGAESGELVIMAGGEREIYEKALPYLKMMGKSVTYMGESGCGSTAKLANNIMVGVHLLAMGEAYVFARKAGISPNDLFQAIKGGSAQSTVMDTKVPKILERDFSASARIAVHLKDINNALETAEDMHVNLPLTKHVKEQMDWMNDQGLINEDQCALIKYYENAMGVEVK